MKNKKDTGSKLTHEAVALGVACFSQARRHEQVLSVVVAVAKLMVCHQYGVICVDRDVIFQTDVLLMQKSRKITGICKMYDHVNSTRISQNS